MTTYQSLARTRNRDIALLSQRTQHLVLTFFSGCFVGWVWETFYVFLTSGELQNRGFFYGPWLPIYGFGCLIMMLIKHFAGENKLLFAAASMGICGVLEYATSWTMEVLFQARWWDYSMEAFNLHGRICLKGLVFFALAGGLFVYVLEPRLRKKSAQYNPQLRQLICLGLLAAFAFDLLFSFCTPNFSPAVFA